MGKQGGSGRGTQHFKGGEKSRYGDTAFWAGVRQLKTLGWEVGLIRRGASCHTDANLIIDLSSNKTARDDAAFANGNFRTLINGRHEADTIDLQFKSDNTSHNILALPVA